MVAASKVANIFKKPLCNLHCSQIVHPGISCSYFFISYVFGCTKSSAFYFLPLLISRILFKAKNLNKKVLSDALKFYLQSMVCASAVNYTIFLASCIYRNLVGRIDINLSTTLPFLSALSLGSLFPEAVLSLFATATSQAAIETILRARSNLLTRFLNDSRILQTVIFMINSCIVLHYKRSKLYKGIWFITPNPSMQDSQGNDEGLQKSIKSSCSHTEKSCLRFLFNGFKSYLVIGLLLDLIAIMSAKFQKLKLQNFKMTSFLIAYIGIYRMSTCFLRKYLSDQWTETVSAFLSGASYLCIRKLSFCTFSFVVATKTLWQHLGAQPSHPQQRHYKLRQHLKRLHLAPIILGLNVALLTHQAIFRNHIVSGLGRGFLNGTGNSQATKIHKLLSLEEDVVFRTAAAYSIKGFFKN